MLVGGEEEEDDGDEKWGQVPVSLELPNRQEEGGGLQRF